VALALVMLRKKSDPDGGAGSTFDLACGYDSVNDVLEISNK
jgi:hypothetical protein